MTTLYYVAPACFAFLLLPFAFLELPAMRENEGDWALNPPLLLGSAAAAFGERMAGTKGPPPGPRAERRSI